MLSFKSTFLVIPGLIAALLFSPGVVGQETPVAANYKLAQKYSSKFLGKFVYDSSVRPTWIGESELLWYRFRTSSGSRYWLVDPVARTKIALFDHETMAARLSEACETPLSADSLELRNLKFGEDGVCALGGGLGG